MDDPILTVIIPTHNPQRERLARALDALRAQTLPVDRWELVIVDNGSAQFPDAAFFAARRPVNLRIVAEAQLGLTPARLQGFAEARGELLVLVDDDNVLAPDYLRNALAEFERDPGLGAAGGPSRPGFEAPPPLWTGEFAGLLALRDLGNEPLRSRWHAGMERGYPPCAPVGAGLVLRRASAIAYAEALRRDPSRRGLDRAGNQLVSGGDNDLVMTILEAGLEVAYLPNLELTHLIPVHRTERRYLGALNRAIARSWVRVLALHGITPWPAISRKTVPLRQLRAWWQTRAARGPAEWVRWQGLCGMFEGRADLARPNRPASR